MGGGEGYVCVCATVCTHTLLQATTWPWERRRRALRHSTLYTENTESSHSAVCPWGARLGYILAPWSCSGAHRVHGHGMSGHKMSAMWKMYVGVGIWGIAPWSCSGAHRVDGHGMSGHTMSVHRMSEGLGQGLWTRFHH